MGKLQNRFELYSESDQAAREPGVVRLPGRAGELQVALRPLQAIKPVLSCRYLIKGWLDRGATSLVYGESNVGKTFFALDIAMHVAAGKSWHGAKVSPKSDDIGCVVYIAGEGGSGLHNRVEAIRREKKALVDQAQARQSFKLLSTMLDLCGASDAEELAKTFNTLPSRTGLIIIDTLARTMGDGDENTARDMGMFIRSVDHLRTATGAHVMVIHHSGKDASKGARGSGSLRAAMDTEIQLTRSGAVIIAETRKQRDMPCGNIFTYCLHDVEIGEDEDGEPVTSAVITPTEAPTKHSKLTANEIVVWDAALEYAADYGKPNPGGTGWPEAGRFKVVELCAFKKFAQGRFSNTNPRQSVDRALRSLQSKGQIGVNKSHIWPILKG